MTGITEISFITLATKVKPKNLLFLLATNLCFGISQSLTFSFRVTYKNIFDMRKKISLIKIARLVPILPTIFRHIIAPNLVNTTDNFFDFSKCFLANCIAVFYSKNCWWNWTLVRYFSLRLNSARIILASWLANVINLSKPVFRKKLIHCIIKSNFSH